MPRWFWVGLTFLAFWSALPPAVAESGFQAEVKVQKPTRLDWEFAAGTFGADATQLPSDYLSYRQRYQLFEPADYQEKKTWPLVVFISPGDDPLGWRAWQKVCEAQGVFFCAAFGAGNNQPMGVRVRIVSDMLDDVRRHYRIDPEQTYFVGLGEGGRLASALAYAMPEMCGGVVLIGATPVEARLDYLRHRMQDRLSTAFVIGEKDGKRRAIEEHWHPYYRDLEMRTRLWSMKAAQELPPAEVVAEVYTWLVEDLPRRRKDLETRPKLGVQPDEALAGPAQAARLLESAQAEVVQPGRLYRGVVQMQGVAARWPKSEAAEKALLLLRELQIDQRLKQQLAEQTNKEERRMTAALARARERLGELGVALALYEKLAANHADSEEGKMALVEAKRLKEKLAGTPYLGISFEDDGVTVRAVAPKGPADQAGLRAGDRLVAVGATKLESLADLQRALQALKPGNKTTIAFQREGKAMSAQIELGATPVHNGD